MTNSCQLGERKDQMRAQVAELEQQLNRTAGQLRGDQREAGNKLREAAGDIRDQQIKEKIQYSKGALAGSQQFSRDYEQVISSDLQNLQNTINQAAEAMNSATRQPANQPLTARA